MNLGWGGRQAGEVVGGASNQSAEVGTCSGLVLGFGKLGVDEGIDGFVISGRERRFFQRLESPDVFRGVSAKGPVVGEASRGFDDGPVIGDFLAAFGEADLVLDFVVGPGSAVFDPSFNMADLFGSEPVVLLGGHFVFVVLPLDHGHEEGFFDIPGDEELADEFTTFEKAVAGEKIEVPLNVFGVIAMAGGAFCRDDRESVDRGVLVRSLGAKGIGGEGKKKNQAFHPESNF